MKNLQALSDTNASLSIYVQSILAEIRKEIPDINGNLIIWKSRWNYVKTETACSYCPTKVYIDKITSLLCIHIETRLNICMQWQMTRDPFESL